ncbi:unnamed protein product [Scytosiphon promiscuus]
MAAAEQPRGSESERRTDVLHLLTPAKELEAMKEPTAGVDLMDRHQLHRCYEEESRRTLRKGMSHFLSPTLQALIKEKPRIALSEKAEFAELLSEEPSGRRIEELSVELLRRSFFIRRRVATAPGPAVEEDDGGPPVPPDVPMAQQTTNKFSPAFAKKAKQIAKQASKRPRPLSDDEGESRESFFTGSGSSTAPPHDVRSAVKPLISKLVAMKWPGWSNPFMTVFKKSNAPPRYFEFIKRPMNLTFIRENLNKNKYMTVEEVEVDLELIVSNALTFNRPIDPVYQFALELQMAFRSELPLVKQALEEQRRRQGGGGGSSSSGGGGHFDNKKQRVR